LRNIGDWGYRDFYEGYEYEVRDHYRKADYCDGGCGVDD